MASANKESCIELTLSPREAAALEKLIRDEKWPASDHEQALLNEICLALQAEGVGD